MMSLHNIVNIKIQTQLHDFDRLQKKLHCHHNHLKIQASNDVMPRLRNTFGTRTQVKSLSLSPTSSKINLSALQSEHDCVRKVF